MTVTVRYFGQARAAARAHEHLDLGDRATVDDLLAAVAARYGDAMRAVAPALLVFVGNEQVDRGVTRALRDGDHVMLLAPIAGG